MVQPNTGFTAIALESGDIFRQLLPLFVCKNKWKICFYTSAPDRRFFIWHEICLFILQILMGNDAENRRNERWI